MATLLFTAIGTLVGGPLGGLLGAMAGQEVDSAIFGSSNYQGPRLSDLSVTTSSYGSAIPRHFGSMRTAGSIIWATDLVENSQTSGGKGQPSVTTYTYSSSFAVALASRPLLGVGRIWADGNLLRGAAGDLKVGGAMRFYPGDYQQAPDPLIASVEGTGSCPAFRGVSYVVFEDLQLANFGNRIPTLSFEVFADNGALSLAQLFDGVLDNVDASVPLDGVLGFSCEGSLKDTLAKFQPVFPMDCAAGGETLIISPERLQTAPIALSDPAVSSGKGDFGANAGYTRKRAPLPENPPRVLRYYDIGLDYQPGSQRAPGQPLPGQPKAIQLPATLDATNAFRLICQTTQNSNWARETIAWRSTSLDPAVMPGAIVTVEGQPGQWRVNTWEWRATGVELSLERLAPTGSGTSLAASAGRANLAADLAAGQTQIDAFELPWNGVGSSDSVALYAAVSSSGPGWNGAALYVDTGDGGLAPLGTSGRQRSTIGTTATALPSASPLLFDRNSTVTVSLISTTMTLTNASPSQMAMGANQALVGNEIIQFGTATSLGQGSWQLGSLLRGRGGTEGAIAGHRAGESFILLDGNPIALDASLLGSSPGAKIAAIGLGDQTAVESGITCWGITLKPLSPVISRCQVPASGGLSLNWTRRARGAWQWLDGVDAPLVEETEAYQVSYGPADAPIARWTVGEPSLALTPTDLTSLSASLPNGEFYVRQVGTYGMSDPLYLTSLA